MGPLGEKWDHPEWLNHAAPPRVWYHRFNLHPPKSKAVGGWEERSDEWGGAAGRSPLVH